MPSFICRECGHSLDAEHRFCPVCGAVHEEMEKATQEGIEAFEQGEYDRALQLFKLVEKKQPFSAFAMRDIGHAAFHLQDYSNALTYYEKALKIHRNLLDVHFNMGVIHMQRGHLSDAMFSFMETLHLIHPLTSGSYYLGLFHTAVSLTAQCRLNLGTLFKERGS